MSQDQPTMSCCSSSNFDEYQWVINVGRALEKELEDDDEDPVCIFTVPKTLMSSHPDTYTPQQLSLGPYHYLRPDLHEMECYKLSAAKKLQNQLHSSHRFENLVEQLIKLEPKIRACYHKYLSFNAETLAWMMALDVSFLLEFLQIYSFKETSSSSRVVTSRMSHLLDYSKRKSVHHVILRDMVMLENQVPLFVLRKVLEFQHLSVESADEMLLSMIMGLAKDLSPFKTIELPKSQIILEHSHLLDLLYDIIVPKVEEPVEISEEFADQIEADKLESEGFGFDSNYVKQLLKEIWNTVSQLTTGPVGLLIKNISSTVTIKLKFSWTILSKLLHISPDDLINTEDEGSSTTSKNKPPLGNISTINFDKDKAAFYLPTISLDINTESDEEVANMLNGMSDSKAIRLTKAPILDKVIEDVNKYHGSLWMVKIRKFMKRSVFSSWQYLTLVAAIFLMLLLAIESFCTVFKCYRIFHIDFYEG
uniref:Uncharacterized protein n=2 Tax=Populus alba TaxID=43335 RepID=A0A4U5MZD0_POPAL|nr:hypothetical protein D5086_0000284800 [Populus alba]